jgi:hypothetical protein
MYNEVEISHLSKSPVTFNNCFTGYNYTATTLHTTYCGRIGVRSWCFPGGGGAVESLAECLRRIVMKLPEFNLFSDKSVRIFFWGGRQLPPCLVRLCADVAKQTTKCRIDYYFLFGCKSTQFTVMLSLIRPWQATNVGITIQYIHIKLCLPMNI